MAVTLIDSPAAAARAEASQAWVACDLCGADDTEVVWTRGRFRTPLRNVICRQCGLVYVNPRMAPARYRQFVLAEYRRKYAKPTQPTDTFRQSERRRAETILSFVGGLLPPGGRVLEVGSRTGDLLDVLRARTGCSVEGIEPDARLASFANQTLRVPVLQGAWEDLDRLEGPFDLVILCHVLEHMLAPTEALRKIRSMLGANACVYVEVPNLDTPYRSLSDYFQDAHPYSFSPRTLTALVHKAGFSVAKIELFPPAIRCILRLDQQVAAPASDGDDWRRIIGQLMRYQHGYWWRGVWIRERLAGARGYARSLVSRLGCG